MDMKRIWILCLIYIIGVCDNSYAEEVDTRTVSLSLTDAIRLAQIQSVDAAVALNELKTAYWEYRTHKAEQLPDFIFTGTFPSYTKKYYKYQHSDGFYYYVQNKCLRS